jgi:hypothetical protein
MKRKDVLDIIEIGNAGYSIGAGWSWNASALW